MTHLSATRPEASGPEAARLTEIASHTALRGLAAVMVVIYHYRPLLKPHFDVDAYTGLIARSYVAVDLFFILSGFIIAAVYSSRLATGGAGMLRSFYVARLARLYPLHLLTLAFMVAITLRGGRAGIEDLFGDIVQNVLMIHAWGLTDRFVFNFPSWSISGEWAAYLLFPLLALLLARRGGAAAFWVVIVAAYALLIAREGGLNADERLSLARAVPGFMLGMLVHRWRNLATGLSDGALTAMQAGALAWIVVAMHLRLEDATLIPAFAILTFALWTDRGAVAGALARGPLAPVFARVGLWSYTIYMMHIPVRAAMEQIWPKLPLALAPAPDRWAFFAACVVMTFASSAVVYAMFEAPVRDWLRRRFGRPRA